MLQYPVDPLQGVPGVTRRLLVLPLALALLSGCSSSPGVVAVPRAEESVAQAPAPEPPRPPEEARTEATESFYRGKALALAGEPACARAEFQEALDTFRRAARQGDEEDLAFAGQLYESVALYDRRAAGSEKAQEERPPADDDPESLVAKPPTVAADEVATAEREVAESPGEFDIPVVVNEKVLKALAHYQFRTPQAFASALQRSGRYIPMMRQLLKEAGLPQDLVYIAMIESAFKPRAHSRKAAHGFWQFIDGTARRYGLRKTREIDERSDPVKSTKAAAAYLRDLYEMFGDWHLAMAAYDTGEGRVLRALQATGAKDYWELSSGNALHREARDYVPYVMAAALISHDPKRFGFDVVPDPPLAFDLAEVPHRVDLGQVARVTGTTLEEMQTLNGELRLRTTPKGRYTLRLPAGTAEAFLAALPTVPAAREIAERRVKVRRGDTLAKIARRYRVSVAELCEWNEISANARPKRGTILLIPGTGAPRPAAAAIVATAAPVRDVPRGEIRAIPTSSAAVTNVSEIGDVASIVPSAAPSPLPKRVEIPEQGFAAEPAVSRPVAAAASAKPARAKSPKKVVYTVKRGDTLYRIARSHGLSVDAVRRANGLRPRQILEAGRRLTLIIAAAR